MKEKIERCQRIPRVRVYAFFISKWKREQNIINNIISDNINNTKDNKDNM